MTIYKDVKFSERYNVEKGFFVTPHRFFSFLLLYTTRRFWFLGVHDVSVRSGRRRSDGREIQQRNDIGQQSDRAAD